MFVKTPVVLCNRTQTKVANPQACRMTTRAWSENTQSMSSKSVYSTSAKIQTNSKIHAASDAIMNLMTRHGRSGKMRRESSTVFYSKTEFAIENFLFDFSV